MNEKKSLYSEFLFHDVTRSAAKNQLESADDLIITSRHFHTTFLPEDQRLGGKGIRSGREDRRFKRYPSSVYFGVFPGYSKRK